MAATYEDVKHACIIAVGALYGLIDSEGRDVRLADLVDGDFDEAVRLAAAHDKPVPELKRYADALEKVHTDEERRLLIYDLAKLILKQYDLEPSTREVTGTYSQAAAAAALTLDAVDAVDATETLGDLFATADTFMRNYTDAIVEGFGAVCASGTAMLETVDDRKIIVEAHRKQLDEQLAYIRTARDTLDRLRTQADTTSDVNSRTQVAAIIKEQIYVMEDHMIAFLEEARKAQLLAVEQIRTRNQVEDNHVNPVPLSGRALVGG